MRWSTRRTCIPGCRCRLRSSISLRIFLLLPLILLVIPILLLNRLFILAGLIFNLVIKLFVVKLGLRLRSIGPLLLGFRLIRFMFILERIIEGG